MDLRDVTDSILTVLVGFVALVSLEWLLFRLRAAHSMGFFDDRLGFNGATANILFIALSFVVGAFCEDASLRLVDDRAYPRIVERAFGRKTGTEQLRSELRLDVLFNGENRGSPIPLARELADNNLFTCFGGRTGPQVNDWVIKGSGQSTGPAQVGGKPTPRDFSFAAGALYYTAKNHDYSVDTYSSELRRIELRIDFTRSLSLIAMATMLVYLVFAIAVTTSTIALRVQHSKRSARQWLKGSGWRAWPQRTVRGIARLTVASASGLAVWIERQSANAPTADQQPEASPGSTPRAPEKEAVILLASAIGAMIVTFAAFNSYKHEVTEFNKRSFGYFATSSRFDPDVMDAVHSC